MLIVSKETKEGKTVTSLEGILWLHHKEDGNNDDSVSSLESLNDSSDDEDDDDDEEAAEEQVQCYCPPTPATTVGHGLSAGRRFSRRSAPPARLQQMMGRQGSSSSFRRIMTTGSIPSSAHLNLDDDNDSSSEEVEEDMTLATPTSRWSSHNSNYSVTTAYLLESPRAPSRQSSPPRQRARPRCSTIVSSQSSTQYTASTATEASSSGPRTPLSSSNARSRKRFSTLSSPRLTLADTSSLRRVRGGDPLKRRSQPICLTKKHRLQKLSSFGGTPRLPPRQISNDRDAKE